jgi:hypothetical protein
MKKSLLVIMALGCYVSSSFATDARVVSMGRHDAFFMDEISIFKNPANISIYPNMVYGSYGVYTYDAKLDSAGASGEYGALNASNRDPVDPFFGAIMSYSLNQNTDNGSQYPMLSIGAVFNRRDEMLSYLTPGSKNFIGSKGQALPDPVGKIDLLLGYVLPNGVMLGGGGYVAIQKKKEGGDEAIASIYKGNLGLNWPLTKSIDLEISAGGGLVNAVAKIDDPASNQPTDSTHVRLAKNDVFLRAEARLFTALAVLNGDFVPHVKFDYINLEKLSVSKFDLAAGVGLNINIDKGFFWAGLEFLYGQHDSIKTVSRENVGGRISFGIERNILTDWFVIRVGGQKEIRYVSDGTDNGYWEENVAADGSDNDLVGLGFGINIDNRLRIDFVAAEDIAYTFTNLVSHPQHHLFNRVSATYSF